MIRTCTWMSASGATSSLRLCLILLLFGVCVLHGATETKTEKQAKTEKPEKAKPAPRVPVAPVFNAIPGARDPFAIPAAFAPKEKTTPLPTANGDTASITPKKAVEITGDDVAAAVGVQAIMQAGKKFMAIINGQATREGDKVSVTLQNKPFVVEIVKIDNQPEQVVIRYSGKDYVRPLAINLHKNKP